MHAAKRGEAREPVMWLIARLAAGMACALMAAGGPAEARRVALVIGNATYNTLPSLKNAGNDSKAVTDVLGEQLATALQRLELYEASRRQLQELPPARYEGGVEVQFRRLAVAPFPQLRRLAAHGEGQALVFVATFLGQPVVGHGEPLLDGPHQSGPPARGEIARQVRRHRPPA
mgnify:CR=1 FL=1